MHDLAIRVENRVLSAGVRKNARDQLAEAGATPARVSP